MDKVYTEKEQAIDVKSPYDWGPEIEQGWTEVVRKMEDEFLKATGTQAVHIPTR